MNMQEWDSETNPILFLHKKRVRMVCKQNGGKMRNCLHAGTAAGRFFVLTGHSCACIVFSIMIPAVLLKGGESTGDNDEQEAVFDA